MFQIFEKQSAHPSVTAAQPLVAIDTADWVQVVKLTTEWELVLLH
jgi:hypothetical protein